MHGKSTGCSRQPKRILLKKYNKYFQNKKSGLDPLTLPTKEQCQASGIGSAYGVMMDRADGRTVWPPVDLDPAQAQSTGLAGTRMQGSAPSRPSTTQQRDRPSSSQPFEVSSDSLSLLALAAWTGDGDEQLLQMLHQRLDSNMTCLSSCSEAMSRAIGDFVETQHRTSHYWLEAMRAGEAAFRALATVTTISREFYPLCNAQKALHEEYFRCLNRCHASRKRGRDADGEGAKRGREEEEDGEEEGDEEEE